MKLAAAIAIICLPAVIALSEAVSFYSTNANNGHIGNREYLLYVPNSYQPGKPTPLVISMHGAALWPASQMGTSQWNRAADKYGFIVVYPAALDGNGPRIFHVEPTPDLQKDVRFISDLIDTLVAKYDVDSNRIYANGLSNGGGMSFVLSCALSERIAAVGLVASAQTLPFGWCANPKPVPVITFHGTADPVTPYYGGRTWISSRSFPSIPAFVEQWAKRNRCSGSTQMRVAADVIERKYVSCAADVDFYTIEGGGHTWPGGKPLPHYMTGRTTYSIDADELMWQFFRAHLLHK